MAALPYIPLYVADYLADTGHLSASEHGAYLLLIMNYWQRGKPLQALDERLARVARMSNEEWLSAKPTLAEFFEEIDGEWVHARLERDLAAVRAKSDKARAAGQASAERRSNVRSTDVERPSNHTSLDTDTEKKEHLPSEDCPPPQPDEVAVAFEAYNSAASQAGWSKAGKLDARRRASLKARLADCGGVEGWQRAMQRARASPFLTGDNDRGWRASLDFFLQAKSFTKLIEGAYDGHRSDRTAGQASRPRSGADAIMAALAQEAQRPDDRGLVHGRATRTDFEGGPVLDLEPNWPH